MFRSGQGNFSRLLEDQDVSMSSASLTATLIILSGLSPGRAQSASIVAIRARALVDVIKGELVDHPVVLLEGDRITAVGRNIEIPRGAKVIDLGDRTLLPGLIDCHTHLLQKDDLRIGNENLVSQLSRMSTAKRALLGVKNGQEDLFAGITTVRDVGNSGVDGAIVLRDAIEAGWVTGPRIIACGRALSPIGGQFPRLVPEARGVVDLEYAPICGVLEAQRAVRQSIYEGADWIKVITDPGPVMLSTEEMKAIVEETHRLGKKVAAHAIAPQAVSIAIEAGVDSIEHAYDLTEAQAKQMAAKGIYLVPTDRPRDMYYAGLVLTPEERKRAETNYGWFTLHNRERLARAIKAGVLIAAGADDYDDTGAFTRGDVSRSMFEAYVEGGMSPLDSLRAGTINAAKLLGREQDLGSLEPGKYADIIAVAGNLLKDIHALRGVAFVMKGGIVVRNDRTKE
jgi:imidazolonepropionase-like amidohydrolase